MTRILSTTVAAAVLSSACATGYPPARPVQRQECVNPAAQLAAVLAPYEALRSQGCTQACAPLRREIERLAVVCPTHAPTLMANAVLAYDDERLEFAQQLLDQILGQAGTHPEAAVLRARIAIQEGNLPFAGRMLRDQIRLSPDHAGLHETLGGTLFLSRQYAEATRALTAAAALGAPSWRIAYHLGLVDEAEGRMAAAAQRYTEALAGNPGWALAQSRLNAIKSSGR